MTPVKRNALVSAAVVALLVAFIAGALALSPKKADPADAAGAATGAGAGTGKLVRDDSHRLGAAGTGKVTLVEFLDFECEVCGAVYPSVEEIREEYAGEISYVLRYFPIPAHQNSMNAAIAAAAAACNSSSVVAEYPSR